MGGLEKPAGGQEIAMSGRRVCPPVSSVVACVHAFVSGCRYRRCRPLGCMSQRVEKQVHDVLVSQCVVDVLAPPPAHYEFLRPENAKALGDRRNRLAFRLRQFGHAHIALCQLSQHPQSGFVSNRSEQARCRFQRLVANSGLAPGTAPMILGGTGWFRAGVAWRSLVHRAILAPVNKCASVSASAELVPAPTLPAISTPGATRPMDRHQSLASPDAAMPAPLLRQAPQQRTQSRLRRLGQPH